VHHLTIEDDELNLALRLTGRDRARWPDCSIRPLDDQVALDGFWAVRLGKTLLWLSIKSTP